MSDYEEGFSHGIALGVGVVLVGALLLSWLVFR